VSVTQVQSLIIVRFSVCYGSRMTDLLLTNLSRPTQCITLPRTLCFEKSVKK